MKTSEFIRRVESIGYKTVKTDSYINIYDADNMIEPVASVNMYCTSQLFIYDAYYHLAKFIVEYAETPLDEREDEKKYYVKVFKGYRGYLNVSHATSKFMTADMSQTVSYQTQFTEIEIEQLKRRDDIPLDWDKVELIEVTDDED